jgi:hypothetical protein
MRGQVYDKLPHYIKDVVDSCDYSKDLYAECRRIHQELESKGWTCEYGLDGIVYDVTKLLTK